MTDAALRRRMGARRARVRAGELRHRRACSTRWKRCSRAWPEERADVRHRAATSARRSGPDVRARMMARARAPRPRCAARRDVRRAQARRSPTMRWRPSDSCTRGCRSSIRGRSPTSRWAPTMARSGSATTARSTAGRTTPASSPQRGVRFRTWCDTEFILRGYEAWGIEGLLPRLRGMFAFALVDFRDAARARRARPARTEADRLRARARGLRVRLDGAQRAAVAAARGARILARTRSMRISRIATCRRRARSSPTSRGCPTRIGSSTDSTTGRSTVHRYWSPRPARRGGLRRAARRGDRAAAGRRPAARAVPVGRHRFGHHRVPAGGDGSHGAALVLRRVSRHRVRRERGGRGDRARARAAERAHRRADDDRRRLRARSWPRSTSRSPTRRRFRRGTSRARPSGT